MSVFYFALNKNHNDHHFKIAIFEKGETLDFSMTAEHGSKGSFSSHGGWTTSVYRSTMPCVAVSLCIDEVGSLRINLERDLNSFSKGLRTLDSRFQSSPVAHDHRRCASSTSAIVAA